MTTEAWIASGSAVIAALALIAMLVFKVVKYSKEWIITLLKAIIEGKVGVLSAEFQARNKLNEEMNKEVLEISAELKATALVNEKMNEEVGVLSTELQKLRHETVEANRHNRKVVANIAVLIKSSKNHGARIKEAELKLVFIGKIIDLQTTLFWVYRSMFKTMSVSTVSVDKTAPWLDQSSDMLRQMEEIAKAGLIITGNQNLDRQQLNATNRKKNTK